MYPFTLEFIFPNKQRKKTLDLNHYTQKKSAKSHPDKTLQNYNPRKLASTNLNNSTETAFLKTLPSDATCKIQGGKDYRHKKLMVNVKAGTMKEITDYVRMESSG